RGREVNRCEYLDDRAPAQAECRFERCLVPDMREAARGIGRGATDFFHLEILGVRYVARAYHQRDTVRCGGVNRLNNEVARDHAGMLRSHQDRVAVIRESLGWRAVTFLEFERLIDADLPAMHADAVLRRLHVELDVMGGIKLLYPDLLRDS